MSTETRTAKEALSAAIADLGLGVTATFVPWSQSRAYVKGGKVNDRSLNWKVTITHHGREVLTTDYGAGIGHCPAYSNHKAYGFGFSIDKTRALEYETEHGRVYRTGKHEPITPDSVDVIWSLVQDASVLDAGGFEDWASEYGYDTDSRKAEATYKACLELALKLRAALGDEGLKRLQAAGQDY